MCNVNNLIITIIIPDIAPREHSARRDTRSSPPARGVTKEDLNARLEEWRLALESKGLRISRSKTKYLHCNFSGNIEEENHVTIGEQEVPKTTKFKYLGSFIQSNGDTDCDVAHHVQPENSRNKVGDGRDENVKMDVWTH
ncbi:hypothetical protein E3N88_28293 [Mikania micrantha]|uniref:Reverse transcriptase domain-containing protein n=1 Tax=Mikania micrantha TaxID=192012 RepID=A0A5N6N224_9ASTR|nr:hypothetical protein E3N88_28293 [Mikania micrantha]